MKTARRRPLAKRQAELLLSFLSRANVLYKHPVADVDLPSRKKEKRMSEYFLDYTNGQTTAQNGSCDVSKNEKTMTCSDRMEHAVQG